MKIHNLVEPYDDQYVKIKQATKQGYILCGFGGVVTWVFQAQKQKGAELLMMA